MHLHIVLYALWLANLPSHNLQYGPLQLKFYVKLTCKTVWILQATISKSYKLYRSSFFTHANHLLQLTVPLDFN